MGGFACFSPFNSFRINESFSELSKICIQLRHIYARNPFGISTRCAHLQHVHFHPLTVSIPYSCFVSFTPSLTTPSAFHYPIPVRTKLTAEGVQDAGAIWVTSPLQIYLARSVFRRERNLNPAKREPAPGSLNCPRRRNSKQRGTL